MEPRPGCGWSGTVRAFLDTPTEELLAALTAYHEDSLREPPGESQVRAWESSARLLRRCFEELAGERAGAAEPGIVFEYELPRERGRRPDAVVLSDRQALVLEFKETETYSHAYVDQAAAYARDLKNYHAASHNLDVRAALVLVKSGKPDTSIDGVEVVSGATLMACLRRTIPADAIPPDLRGWLDAAYDPLPDIVSAARTLFNGEPLPNLRRAEAAGIPATLGTLTQIVKEARGEKSYHLAVVTGVPGSGKTMVGLQLAYNEELASEGNGPAGLFLSGNGPLVEVLQQALKNKVFVQDVHGFLKQYGGESTTAPQERVLVYDEAQRAWDRNKAQQKRGARISQPEDFIRICERGGDWGVIVVLNGEGQEIHVGEEGGLRQWDEAIRTTGGTWTVHCPGRLTGSFPSARSAVSRPELDLTVSLRSHLATDIDEWVNRLLEGDLRRADALAKRLREQGFDAYLTGDLERAKDYVRTRYAGSRDKRYGLLASSKARDLEFYGLRNDFYATRSVKIGPWYNSNPDDPKSCCALTSTVTEFGSQGLELDFPIIGWGSDMTWDGDGWRTPITRRINAVNPRALRLNSYRVLLTRGRDGFIIFVPPARRYEPTIRALREAGVRPLEEREGPRPSVPPRGLFGQYQNERYPGTSQ